MSEDFRSYDEIVASIEAEKQSLGTKARKNALKTGIITSIVAVVCVLIGGIYLSNEADREEREQYKADVKETQEDRAACDAANQGLRQPLYDFLTDAYERRSLESKDRDLTPQQRADSAATAAEYDATREEMVEAVADVAKFEGSPKVNCSERYPLPEAP